MESKIRQEKLQDLRSQNIIKNVGFGIFSAALALTLNYVPGYKISDKQFSKIRITNPTTDTMYVNILTNSLFNDSVYYDFKDIRIPPNKKTKILMPVKADCNLYFSPTVANNDDELIEFNSSKKRKIILTSEIQKDSIN